MPGTSLVSPVWRANREPERSSAVKRVTDGLPGQLPCPLHGPGRDVFHRIFARCTPGGPLRCISQLAQARLFLTLCVRSSALLGNDGIGLNTI